MSIFSRSVEKRHRSWKKVKSRKKSDLSYRDLASKISSDLGEDWLSPFFQNVQEEEKKKGQSSFYPLFFGTRHVSTWIFFETKRRRWELLLPIDAARFPLSGHVFNSFSEKVELDNFPPDPTIYCRMSMKIVKRSLFSCYRCRPCYSFIEWMHNTRWKYSASK